MEITETLPCKSKQLLLWFGTVYFVREINGAQVRSSFFPKVIFGGAWDGRAAFAFGETQHGERKKRRGEPNKGPSGHKQKEEEEDVNWSPPPPSLLAFLPAE